MIHTNRIVTVGEQESIIDRPIVLYRGDREVEIEFTLVGNEFTFSEEGNVIKSVNASHGQLVLNTPSGEHMFSELAECHEGKVVFVVTKEMIDEFIEMGFYSFQIRLYDSAEMKSRVTIPPVMNGFDIRNPIAAEDETNVVDQGIVDYARIFKDQSNEELPTFTWDGEYVKTEWAHHDVITENKMNKIEDALYSINANIKESDVVMLNALDNVKKDADKYVKEHMAEVEADVDEFERNLNTDVQKFKVDTNAAMTAHKNEVSEELESVNSQLTHITNNQMVSVLEFGADPTYTNDSTESIQKAIDYSNETGCTIYFPRGKYRVNGTLYVRDYVSLKGDNNVISGINEFGAQANKNTVLIVTFSDIVFQSADKKEDVLRKVKIGITGLAFQHMGAYDESTFFYKLNLNGSNVSNSLFRGYGTVILGVLSYVTTISHNKFYDCRKNFIKSRNIPGLSDKNPAGITDSYIKNNYINGSVYASDMIAFDVHYANYSSIEGNFIDFFKVGFNLTSGQGLHIINNDIQYCMIGIYLSIANNISITSNRFGLMTYNEHKSAWDDKGTDISHWDTLWSGIYIASGNYAITVTDNQGMSIDKLIRINGAGMKNIEISGNCVADIDRLLLLEAINNDPNFSESGERIFIRDTEKLSCLEQPYNLGNKTFKNHQVRYKGIPLINTGEGRFFRTMSGEIYRYEEELHPTMIMRSTPTGWSLDGDSLKYNNNSTNWSHAYSNVVEVEPETYYMTETYCNITRQWVTEIGVIYKDKNKNTIGNRTVIHTNGEGRFVTPQGCKYVEFDFTTNLSNTEVIFKKPSIKKLK